MIRILEKNIADKIAAGEVVERPLSIVKELVENSIDAGASKIVVEIKDGGKTYIRVTDDGSGIQPDECEVAFMRHATSKIESVSDLDHIGTLGFRGEALASITAVSRTELLTKVREEKSGKRVLVEGGEVVESQMYGCPDGTTIVVRDLFYNTPARLKFLKSNNTESSAVIEFVTHIALAYPAIKVRMINNDKILFATNGKGNRIKTIETLTSKVHTSALIPFIFDDEGVKVEGYVSGPGESKSSRKGQIFFVNGRVINSKVIERGINQAYSERLFDGRFPICYLFLEIAPETMDVNIHPNKREVRFYDERVISDAVRNGIISVLESQDAVPAIQEQIAPKTEAKTPLFKQEIKEPIKTVQDSVDINNLLSTYKEKSNNTDSNINLTQKVMDSVSTIEEKPKIQNRIKEIQPETHKKSEFKVENQNETKEVPTKKEKFDFTNLTVTGQFFGTYIQLFDEEAIYFLDQHAAHERVFYEKFLNQYEEMEKHRQQMLIPIMVDATLADKQREDEWLPILDNLGFTIEEFGPSTYRVTEIPMFFTVNEAEEFLKNFIDNIGEYKDFKDTKTLDKIATKACKAAVKANDKLSDEEIKSLLKDMSGCENPFSCPHGRPTFIKITKSDMEKRFKRI